ncbi:hypothetical protein VTI74DRAFT_5081 [Chaetomium olivicolor]
MNGPSTPSSTTSLYPYPPLFHLSDDMSLAPLGITSLCLLGAAPPQSSSAWSTRPESCSLLCHVAPVAPTTDEPSTGPGQPQSWPYPKTCPSSLAHPQTLRRKSAASHIGGKLRLWDRRVGSFSVVAVDGWTVLDETSGVLSMKAIDLLAASIPIGSTLITINRLLEAVTLHRKSPASLALLFSVTLLVLVGSLLTLAVVSKVDILRMRCEWLM